MPRVCAAMRGPGYHRGLHVIGEAGAEYGFIEQGSFAREEFAAIFLPVFFFGEREFFFGKEVGRYARAFFGGGLNAQPRLFARPFAIEEAGAAVGGAHEPERSVADGEHGAEGGIHRVADARCFIDDEEPDFGEAANGVVAFGQADDSRAVGEEERAAVLAIPARAYAEFRYGLARFSEELAALTKARAGDEDEAFGIELRIMHGFNGARCGFAPLPRAIQDAATCVGCEHLLLLGVGLKAEDFPCPIDRICGAFRRFPMFPHTCGGRDCNAGAIRSRIALAVHALFDRRAARVGDPRTRMCFICRDSAVSFVLSVPCPCSYAASRLPILGLCPAASARSGSFGNFMFST